MRNDELIVSEITAKISGERTRHEKADTTTAAVR
jgi:hypothetical protein